MVFLSLSLTFAPLSWVSGARAAARTRGFALCEKGRIIGSVRRPQPISTQRRCRRLRQRRTFSGLRNVAVPMAQSVSKEQTLYG
ncbi:hypothetical protein AAFF_G00078340 [Aldrovandia affinis]|uniref:Secreted protein n=1 Tax=Aldrovandia affinis TaxID=143900 RepID=A0AAD7RXK6_9TELE|nr:hypothetical protein AAFF_G00078340 [Aldrovandia affinis]